MDFKPTLLLITAMVMINVLKCEIQNYERKAIKGNVQESTEFSYSKITIKDKILSNVVNNAVLVEVSQEGTNHATRNRKNLEVILTPILTESLNKTTDGTAMLDQPKFVKFTKQTNEEDGKDSNMKVQEMKDFDEEIVRDNAPLSEYGRNHFVKERTLPLSLQYKDKNQDIVTDDIQPLSSECNKDIVTDKTPHSENKKYQDSLTDKTPLSSENKHKNQDATTPLESKNKNQDCETDKTSTSTLPSKCKSYDIVTDKTPPLSSECKNYDIVTDKTSPLFSECKNYDIVTAKTPPLSSCKNQVAITDRTPPFDYKCNQVRGNDRTPPLKCEQKDQNCVTNKTPTFFENKPKDNKSHSFANIQVPSFLRQIIEYKFYFLEKLRWMSTSYFSVAAEEEKDISDSQKFSIG